MSRYSFRFRVAMALKYPVNVMGVEVGLSLGGVAGNSYLSLKGNLSELRALSR